MPEHGPGQAETASGHHGSPISLGVPPFLYARPLWISLREHHDFAIVRDVPAQLALKLRGSELTAALLSPIDYARDYSTYRIIPHVGISSEGASECVLLYFNKGLRDLRTVAIDPSSTAEIVLTKLVLVEKYGISPSFLPTIGEVESQLQKADAALLVGDRSMLPTPQPEAIDIIDEWTDLTGFPYVHNFWVSREGALSVSEMNSIVEAGKQPQKEVPSIPFLDIGEQDELEIKEYLGRFKYTLDEALLTAVSEFLRMAYYHGVLQDIPDVQVHVMDDEKNP